MALLFLLRSEHHDHLAAFDLRWEGFDYCQFTQIVTDARKHFHTDLLVGHLTTAETQCDLSLIAIFEKANQAAEFYLVITIIGPRRNLISLTWITFCFFFCSLEDLLFS